MARTGAKMYNRFLKVRWNHRRGLRGGGGGGAVTFLPELRNARKREG